MWFVALTPSQKVRCPIKGLEEKPQALHIFLPTPDICRNRLRLHPRVKELQEDLLMHQGYLRFCQPLMVLTASFWFLTADLLLSTASRYLGTADSC